jgi:hypothetical protein
MTILEIILWAVGILVAFVVLQIVAGYIRAALTIRR